MGRIYKVPSKRIFRFIHIHILKNIFFKTSYGKKCKGNIPWGSPAHRVQDGVAGAGLTPSASSTQHTLCFQPHTGRASTVLRAPNRTELRSCSHQYPSVLFVLCVSSACWAMSMSIDFFFPVHGILNWFLFGNWQCPSYVTYFLQAALVGWDVPLHLSKMGYIRL